MKERVTFTIDKEILKQIDKTIDHFQVKNRSHATELLLRKALNVDNIHTAFIIAGGKGTRIQPITKEIPKSMLPLAGTPLLQYTINHLKEYGVNNIILSVGYKAEKIKEYFGDGHRFGVKITYIKEDEPLGTAGPLKLAKGLLKEPFIMCNADELKEIDLIDMFTFHNKNEALATIALTTVEDPSKYGVARLQGNKIVEFVEKPKSNPPSRLINSGLYILDPKVIDYVPEGYAMIEKDVFPKIAQEGNLFGYSFIGYWQDIGNMEAYSKAIDDIGTGKYRI